MNKNVMTTVLLITLLVGLSAFVLQKKSIPPVKFSIGSERVVQNKVELMGLTLEQSLLSEVLEIFGTKAIISESQEGVLDIHFKNKQFSGFHADVRVSILIDNPELVEYAAYKTLQNLGYSIIQNISITPQRAFPKNTLTLKYGFSKVANNDSWEYSRKGLRIMFYPNAQTFKYSNDYIK
jgi:hypothetical protein